MPSNHLILCHPLLLLPSIFPSIRVFSNELVLCIRWPKYWSFSFSINPSSEYSALISFRMHWFDLPAIQGTLNNHPHFTNKSSEAQGTWGHAANLGLGAGRLDFVSLSAQITDCLKSQGKENATLLNGVKSPKQLQNRTGLGAMFIVWTLPLLQAGPASCPWGRHPALGAARATAVPSGISEVWPWCDLPPDALGQTIISPMTWSQGPHDHPPAHTQLQPHTTTRVP